MGSTFSLESNIPSINHFYYHYQDDPIVNKPVHCIKFLSESDVSVQTRVFYGDNFGGLLSETFDDDDIVDEAGKTMCKFLNEMFFNKEVVKVEIQKKDVNDAPWQSQGILVQRTPGGKLSFYGSIIEKIWIRKISKAVSSSNLFVSKFQMFMNYIL